MKKQRELIEGPNNVQAFLLDKMLNTLRLKVLFFILSFKQDVLKFFHTTLNLGYSHLLL